MLLRPELGYASAALLPNPVAANASSALSNSNAAMNGLLAFLRLMGVEGGEPIPASANLSELLLRASSALVQRCAPGDHRVSDTAALTDAER